jgi:transposase InsO family protein
LGYWDNAGAESFFKTLKTELETLGGKRSVLEVRDSVYEYLEVYYNRKRLHSTLDYSIPAEASCKKRLNLLSAQPGQIQ